MLQDVIFNHTNDSRPSLESPDKIWEDRLNTIGMNGDIDVLEKHLMSAPNKNSEAANLLAQRLMHRTCLM